jgi:hypothetical protein
VLPVKLLITRSVGDMDEGAEGGMGTPQVVLVTQRRADNVSYLSCTPFSY